MYKDTLRNSIYWHTHTHTHTHIYIYIYIYIYIKCCYPENWDIWSTRSIFLSAELSSMFSISFDILYHIEIILGDKGYLSLKKLFRSSHSLHTYIHIYIYIYMCVCVCVCVCVCLHWHVEQLLLFLRSSHSLPWRLRGQRY